MTKTLIALALAAAYLLSLTGTHEPDWLPYAIFALCMATAVVLGVCLEDITAMKPDAALDEHRDNAV